MHQTLTSEIVKYNFYVDDCLLSCECETEAINLDQNLIKMLSRARFRLRKWPSNSERVLEEIPKSERVEDLGCCEFESSLATRVSEVRWKHQTDEFVFDVQVLQRPLTRQGLLLLYQACLILSALLLPSLFFLNRFCKTFANKVALGTNR